MGTIVNIYYKTSVALHQTVVVLLALEVEEEQQEMDMVAQQVQVDRVE